ncbi:MULTISPECIES: pheA operon leader peptide PheL [Pantoea]|uniref:PheA operon leader peptide PheL n=1 Tax=Pantoea brenneri TaxID=472694 RepID=A0ABU9MSV7_9GAMM|nr:MULTISPECIES: pheA operon leader peptide PheL [Pantoea]MBS6033823.1 pheA operon leader peptide PheL [Pantoea sp.]MBZ6395614.1 pheA operon leader peptide PheL [Pantoea sp.]MBZ6439238.1 pheA operon leader peptide PheL [Pantoea sp.]MCQ5469710.1 pheA operon leader peptide PheL [Pantoea brenneri]MDH1089096.1 pheA operon leader peptide PheL [Pantoea brenneri]
MKHDLFFFAFFFTFP